MNPQSSGPSSAAARPFDLAAIGAGLVFAGTLGDLEKALAVHAPAGTAVVQAPPGTGKTTLVPPLVANLAGRVVVTQPRRVAARAAARRLAQLDGSPLGERVGYTVRGEHHAGPGTLVEFVTPGILLRRLLADPGLDGVGAVILDEVHERALDTDLLLGMLHEVHQLRGDLALVAMSATLDAPRFAALIGQYDGDTPAPVVDCPSALHPLDIRWAPAPVARLDERGVTRGFLDHVATTATAAHRGALAADATVDALVFVPGAWEVGQVAARLRRQVSGPAGIEVLELHGQVDAASQDRAVSGRAAGDPPRVIVSTSLAESSLTVPGVRLVIDSGLAREARRDAARGMSGLVTVSASRASSDQRAGRAARQGPGTVVRCFDQKAFGAAPAHPTPEIAVAELTGAALTLACWGAPGGRGLVLPDEPPAWALNEALEVLAELGAIGPEGLATDLGRTLSGIPAEPRLARALIDGTRWLTAAGQAPDRAARAVARIVAMVAGDARAPAADLTRLLASLRQGSLPAAGAWKHETTRFAAIAASAAFASAATGPATAPDHLPATLEPRDEPGLVVALAYPDRVARRVSGASGESYLLASGTRAGLPAGSPLSGHEWLAIAEVSRAAGRNAAGTGAVIRAAAPLDGALVEAAASHLLTDRVEARFTSARVVARRERRLGAIVLDSTPVRASVESARSAVAGALVRDGLQVIGFSSGADAVRRRLALLHRAIGEPWPDVAEPALLERLDDWLSPELDLLAGGANVKSIDLADAMRRLLPWPEAARLGELAPERLQVPSGSHVRITYPEVGEDDGRPVVAVKLQECFGWTETPRLADGRVPVLFHLLSPGRHPLAVTDDLASFWSGPYAQVRAEMRGRYPKHPWPEDPWSVPATAKTTRRLAQGR